MKKHQFVETIDSKAVHAQCTITNFLREELGVLASSVKVIDKHASVFFVLKVEGANEVMTKAIVGKLFRALSARYEIILEDNSHKERTKYIFEVPNGQYCIHVGLRVAK